MFSSPTLAGPPKKLYVGEKIVFSIRLLGLEIGRAYGEVREIVTLRDRQAYHIVAEARSAPILDWIYKVRDMHHSYVDVEKLHTLRYEKILKEGKYRADEVMEYDQENHKATYHSRLNGSTKEMLIPPDVQDTLSGPFFFRLQEIQPRSSIQIPVNADEKNWDVEIKILEKTKIEVTDKEWEAVEVAPDIQFQGIFVRRGKIRGWIGLDKYHTPLRMHVKIPVLGKIVVQLAEYRSGEGQE